MYSVPSSLAALAPLPYSATYGGTKAFVNNFTEALAEELWERSAAWVA